MEGRGTILQRTKDDRTGLVHVHFRAAPVHETVNLTAHILVDLDASGQLVGVEILAGHQEQAGPRLLICGGRNFGDSRQLWDVLDVLEPSAIAHGGARGADRWADLWAKDRGVPCERFEAKWSDYAHAAGPIRNREMLVRFRPDGVVAFPGQRGTSDMIRAAQVANVPVIRIASRRPATAAEVVQ